ncbi:hypothetical protein [Desulfobacter postgatei]|mgnify:CR=1 FL=1|uniref:hypothetical protein n=1 Tax=Desulfobacter postgatei TaxID=2293 RepID=UPI002FD8E2AC
MTELIMLIVLLTSHGLALYAGYRAGVKADRGMVKMPKDEKTTKYEPSPDPYDLEMLDAS